VFTARYSGAGAAAPRYLCNGNLNSDDENAKTPVTLFVTTMLRGMAQEWRVEPLCQQLALGVTDD
jgi:hypothetical protein